jgi:hypothetical protein
VFLVDSSISQPQLHAACFQAFKHQPTTLNPRFPKALTRWLAPTTNKIDLGNFPVDTHTVSTRKNNICKKVRFPKAPGWLQPQKTRSSKFSGRYAHRINQKKMISTKK